MKKITLLLFSQIIVIFSAEETNHHIFNKFKTKEKISKYHVSQETNSVYIGSLNRIIRTDLLLSSVFANISTGPGVNCKFAEHCHNCASGICKSCTPEDNLSRLILIDRNGERLVTCGSSFEGSCEIRDWKTLRLITRGDYKDSAVGNQTCVNSNESPYRHVCGNINNCNCEGIITQGITSGSNVLYLATFVEPPKATEEEKGKKTTASIGVFSLHNDKNVENKLFKFSVTKYNNSISGFFSHNKLYPPEYVLVFETGDYENGYVYFVINAYKSADKSEDEFSVVHEPVIARICKRDMGFFSYIEMPLRCPRTDESTPGGHISSAYFDKLGGTQGKVYATFNHGKNSTACHFDLDEINNNYNDSIYACWSQNYDSWYKDRTFLIEDDGVDKMKTCWTDLYIWNFIDKKKIPVIQQNEPLLAVEMPYYKTYEPINGSCYNKPDKDLADPDPEYFSPDGRPRCVFLSFTNTECGSDFRNHKLHRDQTVNGTIILNDYNVNLTSIIVDHNKEVAFIGDINGKILKVDINKRQIYASLDLGFTLEGKFLWNPKSKKLKVPSFYARGKNEVVLVKAAFCNMYHDCASCHLSKDVYCGWCTLQNKCTTKDECISGKAEKYRWLVPGQDVCVRNINSLVYSVTYKLPVKLKILSLPALKTNSELKYACKLEGSNDQYNAKVDFSDSESFSVLECNIPLQSQISNISTLDKDYLEVEIYVTYGNVKVLTSVMMLYDCSYFSSNVLQVSAPCADCISSRWDCRWNIKNHICVDKEEIDENLKWISSKQVTQCPHVVIDSSTNNLIHVNLSTKVSLFVQNLPSNQNYNDMFCRWNVHENNTVIAKATLVKQDSELVGSNDKPMMRVDCEDRKFYYKKNLSEINGTMRLFWKTSNVTHYIDFPNNTFTFYKCSTQNDCSKCLSIGSKYKCGWCASKQLCSISQLCKADFRNFSYQCPYHNIFKISPLFGPVGGGTKLEISGKNMASRYDEVTSITVAMMPCRVDKYSFIVSERIACYIEWNENISKTEEIEGHVAVTVRNYTVKSKEVFKFLIPTIDKMFPNFGPASGGTYVTLTGSNLNIGVNRKLNLVFEDSIVIPFHEVEVLNSSVIQCRTPYFKDTGVDLQVRYTIDGNIFKVPTMFSYLPDPQVFSTKTLSGEDVGLYSYMAGGRSIIFTGDSLLSVLEPFLKVKLIGMEESISITNASVYGQLEMYNLETEIMKCKASNNTFMSCLTPAVMFNGTVGGVHIQSAPLKASLILYFDSVVVSDINNLVYMPDPEFSIDNRELKTSKYLIINAKNLNENLVTKEEMVFMIGSQQCNITSINYNVVPTEIICIVPPNTEDEQVEYELTVSMGKHTWDLGSATYNSVVQGNSQLIYMLAVVIGVVIVIAILVGVYFRRSHKRYKQNKNEFQNTLEKMETAVRADFRKAFAELSIEMSDINSDVNDGGIPCLDYRVFTTNMFFPRTRQHKCMEPPQELTEADSQVSEAHQMFLKLLKNWNFVHAFVQTLEEERSCTNKDKANVASLLTVVLHSDLNYFTKTVMHLVTDLIEKNLERNLKLLMRRNDSIAALCLSNWLYITLYPSLKNKIGEKVFMLLKAIKQQISKGPLDAVTGKARYTLSDDRLLKEDIAHQNLTLFVRSSLQINDEKTSVNCRYIEEGYPLLNEEDDPSIVKVLSCDTIRQVKEKVMDVIYKKVPFSQRPKAEELELEWHNGQAGQLVLPIDQTTMLENNSRWRRLYTISDYKVNNEATLALKMKNQINLSSSDIQDISVSSTHSKETPNILTPMMSEIQNTKIYHLVKSTDDGDLHRQSTLNRKDRKYIPDLYLLRLINMKGILQQYVQQVIHSIFDDKNTPLPVSYLFNLLDSIAEKHNITDEKILHVWKTNCLPARFWVTILKSPEFVFDIDKPDTIGSCMAVITQTFIDACTFDEIRPTKDSPIHKQLFAKEIPTYMQLVRDYYKKIKESPNPHEIELNSFLQTLKLETACSLDANAAMQDLWPFVSKYYDDIVDKMDSSADSDGCGNNDLFLHDYSKQLLMQTYSLMESGSK